MLAEWVTLVGHDRVISGLFDAENCHIRRLLSLVLKSVDFGAKSPCPASRTLPMENTHAALQAAL